MVKILFIILHGYGSQSRTLESNVVLLVLESIE